MPAFSLGRRLLAITAILPLLLLATIHYADTGKSAGKLTLKKGDRIAIIGNTLADRMQHDGWLEAYIQSRFHTHELSFRNLGFSGDELSFRLRSSNFGSSDSWLTKHKADVIFAFFGYNESFAGKDGLDKFKKDLKDFITHTLAKDYNGKSPPRLVLCSPIAFENHNSPNLPDGTAHNPRIEMYTDAMADLAKEYKVTFVDLYRPTKALYPKQKEPLTINGVHLNEQGNHEIAKIIDEALFTGKPSGDRSQKNLERLRQAIVHKNFFWFQRYRTVDGYSIYGGRADLKFNNNVNKKIQTNREVAQREMEVLDVMTANRDKLVWAAAQSKDYTVDDDNTPPFIPVITNKPGKGPQGKHEFLSGEEAIKKMTVHKNMKVQLFADEKMFPDLMVNPVQMSFDTKGRLWVAVWPTYPHWKPKERMNDKILILEDTDGDGKADKCTVFADNLHCPTGFEFYNGGVLVAQAPDLWFLKDTDGDDKADVRQRVLHGLCSADTHHASNSFVLDPGGALYFQEGTFHQTQVETPYNPTTRCSNAGVFRYEPRTQKFDVYVSFGFANPHGHVFDRWGQDIVVDGTGAQPYHAALFSGYLPYPMKHGRPEQVFKQQSRPCPGMEYMSSKHFPDEMQGNLLVPNVIGFQGIFQYKIRDDGSSLTGSNAEHILSSTDPNFRPSDIKIGPDGAIWFIDWHNPIIGHMQHNLRDPNRDREHGRVYRVTYEGRALSKSPKIAGEKVSDLLNLLKEPEDRVRYRTRMELASRPTKVVITEAMQWAANLDTKADGYEHHLLEGLWLHQSHNTVNEDLLKQCLEAKDFRVRAAATRVLCYWRDRVKDPLALLRKQAEDDHARVRLEAVRAASFFTVAEALEVVLIADEKPKDKYQEFVRTETMKALDPVVKKAIAEGRKIKFTTPAGGRFFLRTVSTEDLMKLDRTQPVYMELLFRKAVRDEYRKEALEGLAKLEKKDELRVLLDAIIAHDKQQAQDESVAYDLIRLLTNRPTTTLAGVRLDLLKIATSARQSVVRQLGYVALVAADGGTDRVWTLGQKSLTALDDVVHAVPLIRDPGQRAGLYPKVSALLEGLPKDLASSGKEKATNGRYVRVELPGKMRTLTLAEVEVYSNGKNVARGGKASQSSTAHGGSASKAIDGNKSPNFNDGGQTHTNEGANNPWWEVDLGKEYPIQSIEVYNRNDGALGSRLKNFTLKILDGDRKAVFTQAKNPAPDVKATFKVGTISPERVIRQLAMQALPSMRGHEADTVKALVKYLSDDVDRAAAIAALQRIPSRQWPTDQPKPVLDKLIAYVQKVDVKERTQPAVLDALQLADTVAGLLPVEEARKVRKELGELGVRVLRLGTVVEQMLYDKERLVVQAGKPFEIMFENIDTMPHNIVIVQPGSLEEIGNLAETTAQQPGAIAREYVPASKKVMHASKLVQPRQSERMSLKAPAKAGVYPYVCTYPGHWRRMHGALYVVADLEAYQADPEGYLKKNPLEISDPLLKFNRPRKEWKLDELASSVEKLTGRNYANGRQMFTVGACVSCHKLGGQGQEFGPDLTKLDPKWTPKDVLQHILEPDLKIDDKYRVWTFVLSSGKPVKGMILKETKETVEVIENPLAAAKPMVIKVSGIEERQKSPSSLMPKGALDKLTREEILDLLAYVVSGANAKHKAFGEGHGH